MFSGERFVLEKHHQQWFAKRLIGFYNTTERPEQLPIDGENISFKCRRQSSNKISLEAS